MRRGAARDVLLVAVAVMLGAPASSLPLAGVAGCSSGPTCHDDAPPAGIPFVEGGSSCTLPDGRPGMGEGRYGCVDPTACKCRGEAGPGRCDQFDSGAGLPTDGLCVYTTCNGADEQQLCARLDGSEGLCCAGRCVEIASLSSDSANCGACGVACPAGSACVSGQCAPSCASTPGACSACATGFTAMQIGGSIACVASTCGGRPDGTTCVLATYLGICCGGACVDPGSDDANCGGCGVKCCAGRQCSPAGADFVMTSAPAVFRVAAECL